MSNQQPPQPADKDAGCNPKDLIGATKAPLSFLPFGALVPVAQVMVNGAKKYGRANWRQYSVQRTIYLEAALRHIAADLEGETIDPESGLPHAAHAVAGLLIMMDAELIGRCKDDRPTPGGFADLCRKLFPPKTLVEVPRVMNREVLDQEDRFRPRAYDPLTPPRAG